jgi:hypothetical protein
MRAASAIGRRCIGFCGAALQHLSAFHQPKGCLKTI